MLDHHLDETLEGNLRFPAQDLAGLARVSQEDVDEMAAARQEEMSAALKDLREKMEAGDYEDPTVTTSATGELDRSASPPVDTAVSIEKLRPLNEALIRVPESFTIHRKLRKCLGLRGSGRGHRVDDGVDPFLAEFSELEPGLLGPARQRARLCN